MGLERRDMSAPVLHLTVVQRHSGLLAPLEIAGEACSHLDRLSCFTCSSACTGAVHAKQPMLLQLTQRHSASLAGRAAPISQVTSSSAGRCLSGTCIWATGHLGSATTELRSLQRCSRFSIHRGHYCMGVHCRNFSINLGLCMQAP